MIEDLRLHRGSDAHGRCYPCSCIEDRAHVERETGSYRIGYDISFV